MGLLLKGFCLAYKSNNISNYTAKKKKKDIIYRKLNLIDVPLSEGVWKVYILPLGSDPPC